MDKNRRLAMTRAEHSECPGCGASNLVAGPRGGLSQNVYCANCMTAWNIAGAVIGIVLMVECIGEIGEEQLAWAIRVYGGQPWRLTGSSSPSTAPPPLA